MQAAVREIEDPAGADNLLGALIVIVIFGCHQVAVEAYRRASVFGGVGPGALIRGLRRRAHPFVTDGAAWSEEALPAGAAPIGRTPQQHLRQIRPQEGGPAHGRPGTGRALEAHSSTLQRPSKPTCR